MEENYTLLKRHIEHVVELTDEEFSFIQTHFSFEKYKKNEIIFSEGEQVKHVYFVLSGLLKLVYTDENGKSYIISFAKEDWWETDFQAYYKKFKASFSLVCLEDTEVLRLSLENFQRLCNSLQKMERFFLYKSISGHIGSEQRILSFLTSGAKKRYEQLLSQQPSLFQRISKSQLASYLGVSRETLSRLFS